MNAKNLKNAVIGGDFDEVLERIYIGCVAERKKRILDAIDAFVSIYGDNEGMVILSVPGRSEISGNHTDHNYGKVVAGSVDCDILAIAAPTDLGKVRIKSEGYPGDSISLDKLKVGDYPNFKSSSLVCGMCKAFLNKGYKIGGIDAYTTSNVLKGSGLSSSAAFEDMVGNILNHMYNDGKVDNVEIAKLAQYSENVFFGKPCGLMDQVACAVGGIVAIDFNDPKAPIIDKVAFDISGAGYNLCIVNTGGNHADLTDDYASVPAEMKAVAAHFGKAVLRDVDEGKLVAEIPVLREKVGDRAVLRALHFFAENKRVAKQKEALLGGDLDAFFAEVLASGKSSFCYLQNVYTSKNLSEQGLSLALCLAEQYLASKGGAWRVHGGGFAGTIQAYVSMDEVDGFKTLMDSVFGEGKCIVLRIRPEGAVKIA